MAVTDINYVSRGFRLALLMGFTVLLFLSGNYKLHSQDSAFVKKKLKESDVEAILSYYTQDGNHSAVTGGEGTEFLQVYSANVNYSQSVNDQKTYYLHVGADIISSASTDRIDFEVSSASRIDQHTRVSLGYSQKLRNKQYELGGSILYSMESDYTSIGGEVWLQHESADQNTGISGSFKAFFDDLRWGRLRKPYLIEAIGLIYPQELRGTEWFDIHNRYSYNLSLGIRKNLNKRMSLVLYPTYSYQQGLLSTPFHRVYFDDEFLPRVENLPRKRNQGAIGVQLNSFVKRRIIIRSFYQFYADDFGLTSNMLKVEVPVKVSPKWSISPFMRYTYQDGSRYFKPYKQHTSNAEFYTSDYDLSSFWSTNIGINLNLNHTTEFYSRWKPGSWSFRYSYYQRGDGLHAHIFSSYFGFGRKKEHLRKLKPQR